MRKATWRRIGSRAGLAGGLVLLIPALAQAQLFPNRTIRRERPPCSAESPFNAQVRRDYFGYYPTCWSRFPAGWACPCPNPELPDPTRAFNERPLGSRKPSVEGDLGTGPDNNPDAAAGDRMPANPAGDGRDIPLPNGGRSPFEMDPNPGKPPAGTAPGADPFTAPNPATPTPPGRPSTSANLLDMPKLPATTPTTSYESTLQPGAIAMAPDASLTSGDSSELRPDLGPLPTAPTPSPSPVSIPNNLVSPNSTGGQPYPGTPAPAQAPRRRSFLGSLFGRDTRNR